MQIKKDKIINKVFSLLREGKVNDGVELLYRNYFGKMYGIAFSILKNQNDSQDAVHNVIAKLFSLKVESLPNINEIGWLYTVIENESLNLLKNNSKALRLYDDMVFDEAYEDEKIKDMIDMDDFQKMISGLDRDRQAVITLKVLSGFTHREIAEILGKPIGTVQWLYATSISRLKLLIPILSIGSVISLVEMVRRLYIYVNERNDISNTGGGSYTASFDGLIFIFGIIAILCAVMSVLSYFAWRKSLSKTK